MKNAFNWLLACALFATIVVVNCKDESTGTGGTGGQTVTLVGGTGGVCETGGTTPVGGQAPGGSVPTGGGVSAGGSTATGGSAPDAGAGGI